ncbi:glycosyltransferase [Kitasatospora phosalacinea]|uniref:glycosyltransferase n=1 Tax=Kitasatospora phosalacinea TaxID=2065 RepID=UPI0035E08E09
MNTRHAAPAPVPGPVPAPVPAPAALPGEPPVQVAELDLARPGELRRPGYGERYRPTGRQALALVRSAGRPLGTVTAHAPDGHPEQLCAALHAAAHRRFDPLAGQPDAGADAEAEDDPGEEPTVSVVVCTRNRPELLIRCLDSLLRTRYPYLDAIVVDNAPTDDAVRHLLPQRYGRRVRYLHEPVPGLARARNRGLAAARGTICAFADDDLVLDPQWLPALAAGFRAAPRTACVTGLVLPAELDTRAQLLLERYGGYGKGFAPRDYTLRTPTGDPLHPFATGRLGTGANMAFRTEVLRAIGGFDPATSTGTPARGGEDLLAFLQVLTAGHTVSYRPDAIVWHPHRRELDTLPRQAFGLGAGFGAYLAAAVHHQPRLLAALLPLVPRGLWRTAHRGAPATSADPSGPADPLLRALRRRELLGLLYGPLGYLRSLRAQRRADHRIAEHRIAERRLAEHRLAERRLAEHRSGERRLAERRLVERRRAERRHAGAQFTDGPGAEHQLALGPGPFDRPGRTDGAGR